MSHVLERLGDYLEGDLPVAERSAVERHLGDCAGCREELRALRRTVTLVRGLPDPAPPPGLRAAVMRGIRAGERTSRGLRRGGAVPLALAAGLAGLVALSLWSVSFTRGPDALPSEGFSFSARPPAPLRAQPARRAVAPPPLFLPSGVAPFAAFEVGPAESELDRQLELLLGDPSAFAAGVGPHAREERFAELARHAARRGRAAAMVSRLIAVPHPVANDVLPHFLAASFAADASGPQ